MATRLLLVDDNIEFLDMLEAFLAAESDITVLGRAETAREAVEKAQSLQPDIVLMDLALPDASGLDAAQRIKAERPATKVVILTLYDSAEYREVARELNLEGYVVKPDLYERLKPTLRALMDNATVDQGRSKEEKEAVKTVLVADDSPTIRRMIIAALQPVAGIRLIQAKGGLEAIEQLALGPVHLIVLDLNMPDIHGLEVLRFVRRQEKFRSLPVIILTTRRDVESRTEAIEAGASCYMTKPFKPVELVRVVAMLLENKYG